MSPLWGKKSGDITKYEKRVSIMQISTGKCIQMSSVSCPTRNSDEKI